MNPNALRAMFEAKHTCVRIVTIEESEVRVLAEDVAHQMKLDLVTWSATDGVQKELIAGESPIPNTTNPAMGFRWLSQSLQRPTLVVLLDAGDHLSDATNLRAFRDLFERVRAGRVGAGLVGVEGRVGKSVILMIDHADHVPSAVAAVSAKYEISTPRDEEIKDIAKSAFRAAAKERGLKVEIKHEDAFGDALVENLRGLSRRQVRQLVSEMASDGNLTEDDLDRVQKGKRALLKEAGVLEFVDAPTSLDEIGGLSRLKDWLGVRARSFERSAHEFGLSAPRGVLLLGVQGAGKSLASKAIATAWRRPLMRLDAGSLFNKYIGETERNLRLALAQAEAMSPVILWIDEIEKGFSSVGSGEDGGVSRRMFGTLLTWMQEHETPVFLVATANDIEQLPPELMRKGRFDEIFFVDLPERPVREQIFRIHLKRRGKHKVGIDVTRLGELAAGFSGAEIEQAVLGGLHRAYSQGREVGTDDIAAVVVASPPMSVTRREAIDELRSWAKGRCVPAD